MSFSRIALLGLPVVVTLFAPITVFATESTCYGTVANGRLANGARLPTSGNNFIGYSNTASLLGRTYVHSKVKSIVLAAYRSLETTLPDKVFKYAETGLKHGGRFKPHKTHQNGLSVDFIVPVVNASGTSVHLPTHYFNKLGYSIEFDKNGSYKDYRIDYPALAAHIVALHKAALAQGAELQRVIFDPGLQPRLMKTPQGNYLRKHVRFNRKQAWVRHDEHYHVDFAVPCKRIRK